MLPNHDIIAAERTEDGGLGAKDLTQKQLAEYENIGQSPVAAFCPNLWELTGK